MQVLWNTSTLFQGSRLSRAFFPRRKLPDMENPLGLSWKVEWGLKMQGSQPKTPSSQRHYFHARFFFKV